MTREHFAVLERGHAARTGCSWFVLFEGHRTSCWLLVNSCWLTQGNGFALFYEYIRFLASLFHTHFSRFHIAYLFLRHHDSRHLYWLHFVERQDRAHDVALGRIRRDVEGVHVADLLHAGLFGDARVFQDVGVVHKTSCWLLVAGGDTFLTGGVR